jgi:hypothetical protein
MPLRYQYQHNAFEKDEIIEQVFELAEAGQSYQSREEWNEAHAQLRELMDQWHTIGSSDGAYTRYRNHDENDAQRQILDQAKDAFFGAQRDWNTRQKAARQELKQSKDHALYPERCLKKQELIEQAKEAAKLSNPFDALKELNDIFSNWKLVGNAGPSEEDLWAQFDSLRKSVKSRRDALKAEREARKQRSQVKAEAARPQHNGSSNEEQDIAHRDVPNETVRDAAYDESQPLSSSVSEPAIELLSSELTRADSPTSDSISADKSVDRSLKVGGVIPPVAYNFRPAVEIAPFVHVDAPVPPPAQAVITPKNHSSRMVPNHRTSGSQGGTKTRLFAVIVLSLISCLAGMAALPIVLDRGQLLPKDRAGTQPTRPISEGVITPERHASVAPATPFQPPAIQNSLPVASMSPAAAAPSSLLPVTRSQNMQIGNWKILIEGDRPVAVSRIATSTTTQLTGIRVECVAGGRLQYVPVVSKAKTLWVHGVDDIIHAIPLVKGRVNGNDNTLLSKEFLNSEANFLRQGNATWSVPMSVTSENDVATVINMSGFGRMRSYMRTNCKT